MKQTSSTQQDKDGTASVNEANNTPGCIEYWSDGRGCRETLGAKQIITTLLNDP